MKEQIEEILDGFAHQYYNIIQAVNNGYTVAFTRIGTDTYADQITALCEAEYQKRIDTMFNPDYLDFKKGVEAGREIERQECQARVERIFEEIDTHLMYHYAEINGGRKEDTYHIWIPDKQYEALKKEEGVDV